MLNRMSLLSKQLLLYVSILIFSLMAFTAAVSKAYEKYYMDKIEAQLIIEGQKIAKEYHDAYFTGIINIGQLESEMQLMENFLDASIFMLNADGQISSVTSKINDDWIGKKITDEAIEKVLEGNIVTRQSYQNSMFKEANLTVGYPLIIGKQVMGGVFMCSSVSGLKQSIFIVQRTVLLILGVILLIGVCLVWFTTKNMVEPVLKINETVKLIADGNFEKRVPITSGDEIGQLAENLNQMAENLEQHDKNQRDFIANISHDLRSPLTSIRGFLEAILDGTVPEEKRNHYLNIVLEETQRLSKLTNDIVLLNEAQSDKMTVDLCDFDINELIKNVVQRFEPRLLEKEIDLSLTFEKEKSYVLADPDKIGRVVQNLVDNAIKFTQQNGKIEIETEHGEDDFLHIMVRDSGKGISAEDQKHVFERFFKTDSSRGEYKKGGGLGLTIAKEFVKANGGAIHVSSEEGKGTEFDFTLKRSDKNR